MANLIQPPAWQLPESAATPEHIYLKRRQLLQGMGFLGVGALATLGLPEPAQARTTVADTLKGLKKLNARTDNRFTTKRTLTPHLTAARYNNFYEFHSRKNVWSQAQKLSVRPWTIKVDGLVAKPKTFDIDYLIRSIPLEERIYRLRCVEAWSMVVPWVGFPLSTLIKKVQPLSNARFIQLKTFFRPEEAPAQARKSFFANALPWPYNEALTIPEAMNELTFLAVGLYGRQLPKQNGAPIRLLTPWKYGFKSIKSIVSITFTSQQPPTFWNTLGPKEYGFFSNVDPKIPHPRWSQAFERDIGTEKRIPTRYLNGYQAFVGHLYQRGRNY